MDLKALVQAFHREARLPGTAPSTAQGQTGRAGDLVQWTIDAWNDIQRQNEGRWKWMRSIYYVDIDDPATGFAPETAIPVPLNGLTTVSDRFRSWDMREEEPPTIYLVSDGYDTRNDMTILPFYAFRTMELGEQNGGYPGYISDRNDANDTLSVQPVPDAPYRIYGMFWKSNQVLSADEDVPEMPVDYHMLIVYRAMVKYGYSIVAPEILASAQTEGQALYDALVGNQKYAVFNLGTGGPIA